MKTNCHYSDDANAYVAGELDVVARIDFEAHLPMCEECQRAMESTQSVIGFLRSAPQIEPVRDLTPVVLARIRDEEKKVRPVIRWPHFAAAAVLVGLCVTAAIMQNRLPETNRPAPIAAKTDAENEGVALAVDWFLRTQETDGSWSAERWGGHKNYAPALTALPLLALLSADEATPGHDAAIARATDWLLKQQNPDGTFGASVQGAPYNHSITTLALLHAYRHSPDLVPKAALDRAVNALTESQASDGGWGSHRYGSLADRAITQWHIQALDLASSLGWDAARPFVQRGQDWLSVVSKSLASPAGPTEITSAIFSLPADESERSVGVLNFYQTYFSVVALEHQANSSAKTRLAAIRRDILNHQVTAGTDGGSWSPNDQWGRAGGRLYSTAMASLSLRSGRDW